MDNDNNFSSYDQLVVVAEKEWKLEFEGHTPLMMSGSEEEPSRRTTRFPVTVGDTEWRLSSHDSGRPNRHITLACSSVAERRVQQVHAEIHGYLRAAGAAHYEQGGILYRVTKSVHEPTPLRHIFEQNNNYIQFIAPMGSDYRKTTILFTVRVLKDRTLLPDFTSPAVQIGHRLGSDVKLRVANQIFHANKQLLSQCSDYFDRMFNGSFREANQAEVELNHEPADPALFHDFLLVLFVQEALPNRNNLSGLYKLADCYDADIVREKCRRHFRMCRELPTRERNKLARELGVIVNTSH